MKQLTTLAAAVALATIPAFAAASATVDWSNVPVKNVTLFYPGQSTYNFLHSPKHKHGAYRKVRKGVACIECHEGEEADLGNDIVKGGALEPNPIKGKNGTVDLKVQAAYDADNIYWRFQWKTNDNRPGNMHDYMRFDGKKWAFYGGPRSSGKVRSGKQPPLYEDRLSIMLDDGSVPLYDKQGCWLTCHEGMRDQQNQPTKAQVKAHPYLGKVLHQHDIRKYLPGTRTDDMASWDKTKSADEIARMQKKGQFLDLMQWRAARSNPVGMADDGYVLSYRMFDSGKKMFGWNVNKKTMTPKMMFDKAKVGSKSLTVAEIGSSKKPAAIIKQVNAVPYDPNAGWKEGDVLPGRLLTTAVKGSAGDNNNAKGTWKDGMWTLLWTRKLNTGHPMDDKILKEGGNYTVSFSVHDDNVTTRFHQVSFPISMGLGVKADLMPTKVK